MRQKRSHIQMNITDITILQQRTIQLLLAGSSVSASARELGIDRTTIYAWRKSDPASTAHLDHARSIQAQITAVDTDPRNPTFPICASRNSPPRRASCPQNVSARSRTRNTSTEFNRNRHFRQQENWRRNNRGPQDRTQRILPLPLRAQVQMLLRKSTPATNTPRSRGCRKIT